MKNKSYDKVKSRMENFLSNVIPPLYSNNKKFLSTKMITIKPGDISNNSEMWKIKTSLLGLRLSSTNPTKTWTSTLHKDNENRYHIWPKNQIS